MAKNLRKAYRTIVEDRFPERLELSFGEGGERRSLVYDHQFRLGDRGAGQLR